MRWVIAPDSYKGSLDAASVAAAMQAGIKLADRQAVCILRPMADGGEGTLDALHAAVGGDWLRYPVSNAVGHRVDVDCLLLPDGTVVLEVARIIGLPDAGDSDVKERSSQGVGQLLLALVDAGYRRIAVALGGSSTNDGGAGCLVALGLQLRRADGAALSGSLQDLQYLHALDASGLAVGLDEVSLEIWSDVENPLTGPHGATAVFGPQKGVAASAIQTVDGWIAHFAGLLDADQACSLSNQPGAGAAGGLGYAMQLLGGRMVSGALAVAQHIALAKEIAAADWVLTGEGRSDSQTLSGKAPACVANLARQAGVPVSLLSGAILADDGGDLVAAYDGCYSLCNRPMTLDAAMGEAVERIAQQSQQLARTILAARYVRN